VGEDSKGEGAFISALSFSVFFGYFFTRVKKYRAAGMTNKQAFANLAIKIKNLTIHNLVSQ